MTASFLGAIFLTMPTWPITEPGKEMFNQEGRNESNWIKAFLRKRTFEETFEEIIDMRQENDFRRVKNV